MEEERAKYEAEVAAEPFARHEIAEAYDEELRKRELWEDPLRQMEDGEARDNAVAEESPTRKRCPFTAPPNRYKIAPGSRWDGRVRGTNFEERFMEARRAAQSKESVMKPKRAF
eukprot:Protomagalhaensia_wolfi_Nauph_80__5316@NODE_575_length_2270_cov_9_753026_g430_i0_p3_GENE_NODE_575_length_2270_cov_9_753026_g430_i0NODE_575_length_2270_cov_9_753026_g430_i0_p3_ORF_typecomplete_len114_score18_57Bud13/PF09736_9/5_5e21_NODE_575_length_2270_cov_9_753026_g430_i0382723